MAACFLIAPSLWLITVLNEQISQCWNINAQRAALEPKQGGQLLWSLKVFLIILHLHSILFKFCQGLGLSLYQVEEAVFDTVSFLCCRCLTQPPVPSAAPSSCSVSSTRPERSPSAWTPTAASASSSGAFAGQSHVNFFWILVRTGNISSANGKVLAVCRDSLASLEIDWFWLDVHLSIRLQGRAQMFPVSEDEIENLAQIKDGNTF